MYGCPAFSPGSVGLADDETCFLSLPAAWLGELADGAWLVVGKREKDEAWRGEYDVLQLGKYVHWHTSSCTDSGEQDRQFGKGGRHRLAMVGRDGW